VEASFAARAGRATRLGRARDDAHGRRGPVEQTSKKRAVVVRTDDAVGGRTQRHRRHTLTSRTTLTASVRRPVVGLIGPIPWGHSGPLCHALSFSSSSSSSWALMRRRHATRQ